ncbi:Coatomer subunit beta (CopB) [Paratrimastix pyriformis]|uniref:Coatomer subunit beta n=1 Tax=Paratrimastix pyriformis TaxID=342808 RepID=A0ABQ8US33_9EUKA|nr:Coatomer subunit beta (CopB) [Paratrimastix pyriformis]
MAQEESADIQALIESKSVEPKIAAVKMLINLYRNGDKATSVNMLMPLIRHCAMVEDNQLKRLLLEYYSTIGMSDADGKLRDQFILVCNTFTQDLQSHNEYVAGITLRFLSRITEKEILQQVVAPVVDSLKNTHAYARRQAIMCVYSIYKEHSDLVPDAPDLIYALLAEEHDGLCQRNALLMLFQCAQEKALQFLTANAEIVQSFSHPVQLLIVELVRTQCRSRPSEKSQWLKVILKLISSSSNSVKYSCAKALLSLSSQPSAIRAAAQCYSEVLQSSDSDNNIKLVVLDRLLEMKRQYSRLLEKSLNLLPIFSGSSSFEIRKRTLTLALELLNSSTVTDMLYTLRKETTRLLEKARALQLQTAASRPTTAVASAPAPSSAPSADEVERKRGVEDRMLVINALRTCATSFAEVVSDAATLLLEYIHDPEPTCSGAAMGVVRELVEIHPQSCGVVLERILGTVHEMHSTRVLHVALWIMGTFATGAAQCARAVQVIKEAVGPLPLKRPEGDQPALVAPSPANPESRGPRIMADGSYAPQTSTAPAAPAPKELDANVDLRSLLLNGDFFLSTCLATALAKLVLKAADEAPETAGAMKADMFAILVAIIAYGQHPFQAYVPSTPINPSSQASRPTRCLTEVVMSPDDLERICICMEVVEHPTPIAREIFLDLSRKAFTETVQATVQQRGEERARLGASAAAPRPLDQASMVAADQLIPFRHFAAKPEEAAPQDEAAELLGAAEVADSSKTQIVQLTGYSDPVYCEASVNVSHYNVLLDFTLVNRTSEPFKDMAIELSTVGDLSASDTTIPVTLPPNQSTHVKTSVKIVSTDTGAIHGSIVYKQGREPVERFLLLRDIHLDIVYCIGPAPAPSALEYRTMWAQFEWENKIPIKCSKHFTIPQFLQHLATSANMGLLPYGNPLVGECAFASANFYARSIFGPPPLLLGLAPAACLPAACLPAACLPAACLLSVSPDWVPTGLRGGWRAWRAQGRTSCCTIRSKLQGIALSLGDKISSCMA